GMAGSRTMVSHSRMRLITRSRVVARASPRQAGGRQGGLPLLCALSSLPSPAALLFSPLSGLAALLSTPCRRQLVRRLVDSEARRLLTRWKLFERLHEVRDDRLCREQHVRRLQVPVPIGVRGDIGAFKGIGTQVVELRRPQHREGLGPDLQGPGAALFEKDGLEVAGAKRDEIAVVVEIDESLARALHTLGREERQQVVAIDVNPEC